MFSRFILRQFGSRNVSSTSLISPLGKSKKKLGKLGPVQAKKVLPVETDPEKLVNYVCGSNIMKEGEDVKLKDDQDYPKWLWELDIGPVKTLDELDPDTVRYWMKVRKMSIVRHHQLKKTKKF